MDLRDFFYGNYELRNRPYSLIEDGARLEPQIRLSLFLFLQVLMTRDYLKDIIRT